MKAGAGIINANEAYSKQMLMARMNISQKFWDRMLDDGLPYTVVGHTRWVTGTDLIEHLQRTAETKHQSDHRDSATTSGTAIASPSAADNSGTCP